MSDIIFTVLPRPPFIIRKYGDFSMSANQQRSSVTIDGRMTMSGELHGNKEATIVGNEFWNCLVDAGLKDVKRPEDFGVYIKRIEGVHKVHGYFIGYANKDKSLVVKITKSMTDIVCNNPKGLTVDVAVELGELLHVFSSLNRDRDEIRIR